MALRNPQASFNNTYEKAEINKICGSCWLQSWDGSIPFGASSCQGILQIFVEWMNKILILKERKTNFGKKWNRELTLHTNRKFFVRFMHIGVCMKWISWLDQQTAFQQWFGYSQQRHDEYFRLKLTTFSWKMASLRITSFHSKKIGKSRVFLETFSSRKTFPKMTALQGFIASPRFWWHLWIPFQQWVPIMCIQTTFIDLLTDSWSMSLKTAVLLFFLTIGINDRYLRGYRRVEVKIEIDYIGFVHN